MQLFRAVILRLLTTAVTLLGVAVIVFVVIRVVPGNPIAMMLPPGATEDDVARLTALYGLDKSIFRQFLIWAGGVLQGDFGTSITTATGVPKDQTIATPRPVPGALGWSQPDISRTASSTPAATALSGRT
jgi:ABC-type dipeptide/oligopeptide/nickel transport system permease component